MRVLFDDRPGLACPTGVGRYARTLGALLARVPGHEALTLSSMGLGAESPEALELDLPALLLAEEIDVFHTPLWHLPALLPCRKVVTVHDAIPATHPGFTSEAFKPLWRRAYEEVPRADAVVSPTEHARGQVLDALSLDPSRVHVVPETPDPVFAPRDPDQVAQARAALGLGDEPYLLVVGSVERRKNPDGLLEALRAVAPARRPLLLFAGPAAEPGFDLTTQASRRGLGDRVRHLGLVPDETLAALYTGALTVLCCSHVEGFGLPVVEAWACGAPVIASCTSALKEVAGDAARLAYPDEPDDIAAAIEAVVDSAALRDDLRSRGRARLAERYSANAVLAALTRVYDALVEVGTQGAVS